MSEANRGEGSLRLTKKSKPSAPSLSLGVPRDSLLTSYILRFTSNNYSA